MSDESGAESDREPVTDPAHALLDRLRAAPAPKRPRRRRPALHPDDLQWSKPGPDERDPAPLAANLEDIVKLQGWQRTLDAASLEPKWRNIVGDAIAEHSRPDTIVAGELTVIAGSSAWATQIRLISRNLLQRISEEIGPGVVEKIRVVGPSAPDWRHGPLRVRGRGPRDTYG